MANLAELSQQISQLVKDAKNQPNHPNYKIIIDAYESEIKNQFLKDEILKSEVLIKNVFNAYKGVAKHEEAAVLIINTLNYKFTPNTDKYFIISFAWNLYYLLKNLTKNDDDMNIESKLLASQHSNLKIAKDDLIEYLTGLLKLLNPDDKKEGNLRVRVLFQFVKFEKTSSTPNWTAINDLLDYLDPDKLETTPQNITIKNGPKAGKVIELATDVENWYSYKTKALLEIEYYNDCINESEKALQILTKFHYDNEIWIKRRIALSKIRLGEKEEGIKLLFDVLLHKKEWFIFKEYAEELLAVDRIEESFKCAIDAALMKGDLLLRLDLFKLLYEILNKRNEPELAKKHALVELLFRIEKKWKIPEYLLEMNTELQNDTEQHSLRTLIDDLKHYWKTFLTEGQVKKIVHDKRIGWVKTDRTEYFFRFSVFDGAIVKLKEGDKVKFSSCQGMNKVKNIIEEDVIYMIAG